MGVSRILKKKTSRQTFFLPVSLSSSGFLFCSLSHTLTVSTNVGGAVVVTAVAPPLPSPLFSLLVFPCGNDALPRTWGRASAGVDKQRRSVVMLFSAAVSLSFFAVSCLGHPGRCVSIRPSVYHSISPSTAPSRPHRRSFCLSFLLLLLSRQSRKQLSYSVLFCAARRCVQMSSSLLLHTHFYPPTSG